MIPCSSPWRTPSTATTSRSTSSASSSTAASSTSGGGGYETFDDLVGYCRLVAGSVGRLSLAVFGTRYPESAEPRADALGVALQLTNILRDVVEDREMGRVYLPARTAAELRLRARPVGADGGGRRARRRSRSPRPRSTSPAASSCCRCSTGAAGRAWRRWPASTGGCSAASPPTRRGVLRERLSLPAREKLWVAARSIVGAAVHSAGGRRVVVVGGGLAGLAAALDAADAGADVTLVERRRASAGRTWSFQRDGLLVDNGQHVFLRCCTEYRAFLDRIGAGELVAPAGRLDVPVLAPGGGRRASAAPGAPAGAAAPRPVARPLPAPPPRASGLGACARRCALRRLDPTTAALDDDRPSATGWPSTARATTAIAAPVGPRSAARR